MPPADELDPTERRNAAAAPRFVRLADSYAGAVAVVGATAWAYAGSFAGVFLFDDLEHLKLGGFPSPRPTGGLAGRPLVYWTFYANYHTGGLNPWGYHAVNLAIHIAAALLLYGLWRRTLALPRYAGQFTPRETSLLPLAAALLWSLHPLATQGVTYILQRCESLAALFALGSLYAFVRGAAAMGRRRLWYAASIGCYLLACSAKEWAAVLPLVVWLYDLTFLSGDDRRLTGPLRRRPWFYTLLCLPLAGLGPYLARLLAGHKTVGFAVANVTPLQYASAQPGVVLHYLRLVVVPEPLCLDYRWLLPRTNWEVAGPAAAMGVLAAAGMNCLARRSAFGFLIGSLFVLLAPTSSIAPIADLAFEHRMYLPLACATSALLLLGYCGTKRFCNRLRLPQGHGQALVTGVVAGSLVVLGLLTARRNLDYQDAVRMWSTVTAARPLNYRGWGNLGTAYWYAGRREEAIAAHREAVRLHGDYVPSLYALGECFDVTGQREEALSWYRRALQIEPRHPAVHNNLGRLAAQQGDFATAERHYHTAMEEQPRWEVPRYNWACALADAGRRAEAAQLLREVLEIRPDFAAAQQRLERIAAPR